MESELKAYIIGIITSIICIIITIFMIAYKNIPLYDHIVIIIILFNILIPCVITLFCGFIFTY